MRTFSSVYQIAMGKFKYSFLLFMLSADVVLVLHQDFKLE